VTNWLRALARHAYAECGGPGVGAVGMCATGGFALAMAVEPALLTPVLSQPPLPLPVSAHNRIDTASLATVRRRCAQEGLHVLDLRFSGDGVAPAERFASLRRELGTPSSPSRSTPRRATRTASR
jgi:dienelactone hydrolase